LNVNTTELNMDFYGFSNILNVSHVPPFEDVGDI